MKNLKFILGQNIDYLLYILTQEMLLEIFTELMRINIILWSHFYNCQDYIGYEGNPLTKK